MNVHKIELTLLEELLGTSPVNEDLYREFIASRRPEGVDEAEAEALPPIDEEIQKGTTIFARDPEGRPALWDYQIKGFFKDACQALSRCTGTVSARLAAYKKIIDGVLFVAPRQIPLILPADAAIGICQRPLRAQTAKGERVSLARSETVPPGTTLSVTVRSLSEKFGKGKDGEDGGKSVHMIDLLNEWCEYGQLRGLGQWRNSGKGRFTCTIDGKAPAGDLMV